LSRVNENQKKQQAEAERMQKTQDRSARDATKTDQSRQKFGEMVKKGAQQQQVQRGQAKKGADQTLGQQVRGKLKQQLQQTGRQARMARGGLMQHQKLMDQAQSFQGALKANKQESAEATQGRVTDRDEGLGQAKEASEERVGDLETKKEDRADRNKESGKAEAKAQGRVNAAIDGASGGKGESSDDASERAIDQSGSAQAPGGAAAAEEVAAGHDVKQIPEEILKAIAAEVFVGVNAKGDAEFRVELKEGVLQGGTLKVTSNGDGHISLQFEGLSGMAKNLVSASHTELAKRLGAKGLSLDELTV